MAASAKMTALLKYIGLVGVTRAKKCFTEQKLGNIRWPVRYPNQSDPFINIAGALEDLKNGASVKARRFDRVPAGVDKGDLKNGISDRLVGENAIEWGSNLPYAGRVNSGGLSVQQITATVRRNLAKLFKKERRKKKKAQGEGGEAAAAQSARFEALSKLGFFFQVDRLETNVAARPFIGLTDDDERKINQRIEEKLGKVNFEIKAGDQLTPHFDRT